MDANFKTILRRQFSTQQHDELMGVPAEPIAERRRDQRIEIETLVAAITNDGSRFEGYTRNIVSHGTAAIIWGDLSVGDEVLLAIGHLAAPKRQRYLPSSGVL